MKHFSVVFLLVCLLLIPPAIAQESVSNPDDTKDAILIDEFSIIGSDDRGARIDHLYINIANNPGARGLIVLYCGKICHYGEFEAHVRGIYDKIRNVSLDKSKISIIFGGYRKEFTTQVWIIPKNGNQPKTNSELDLAEVEYLGLFKWKVVPYDCCALYGDEITQTVNKRREGLPAEVKSFLRSASQFKVMMQTENRGGKIVPVNNFRHEYEPNQTRSFKKGKTRSRLLKAFFSASNSELNMTSCYEASHTIIASNGEQKVEIEISFPCRRYTVTGDLGTTIGSLKNKKDAEEVFNKLMLSDPN